MGIRSTAPRSAAEVNVLRVESTRTLTHSQRKSSPSLGSSAPGSSPASSSTWKPLQMPRTGTPRSAAMRTAAITGERAAMAPVRR